MSDKKTNKKSTATKKAVANVTAIKGLVAEKPIKKESQTTFKAQTIDIIATVDNPGWKGFIYFYQDENGETTKGMATAGRMLADSQAEGVEAFTEENDNFTLVNVRLSCTKGKYSWKK